MAISLRQRIHKARRAVRWTQEHLAGRIGVTQATISNWERRYPTPTSSQRRKLFAALVTHRFPGQARLSSPGVLGTAPIARWVTSRDNDIPTNELSAASGVSPAAIIAMEAGFMERAAEPLVSRLEAVLGDRPYTVGQMDSAVRDDVLALDLDLFNPLDAQRVAGCVVLWDRQRRPVSIVESGDVTKTLRKVAKATHASAVRTATLVTSFDGDLMAVLEYLMPNLQPLDEVLSS